MNDDKIIEEVISLLNLDPLTLVDNKSILRDYLKNYRQDLQVVIEDNYIDKCYRDSFVNFYATKLKVRYGMSLRLSFIEPGIEILKVLSDVDCQSKLVDRYLGFMILRPLCPGLVGRTAVSPKALTGGDDYRIMAAPIPCSVMGLKTIVRAFPHSSQDVQYSTCAETSIWSLMEYYGNKYPEYSPILPSKIHRILENRVFQRHVPSHGLQYTDISYVLMNLGFGCKTYSRNMANRSKEKDCEFHRVYSCYIESGIPLIAAVTDKDFGHAIVCVGKKKFPRSDIKTVVPISTGNGVRIFMWHDVKNGEYIFNDDNKGIYSASHFDNPTPQYTSSHGEISSIIVPLNKKIYLDASASMATAFSLVSLLLKNVDLTMRTILCSGRSFKNAIIKDKYLSGDHKKLFLETIRFPKFIWITEFSSIKDFEDRIVTGLIIQDATEPSEYGLSSLIYLASENLNIFYDYASDNLENKTLSLKFKFSSYEENLTT